jgi:hypothetical protein
LTISARTVVDSFGSLTVGGRVRLRAVARGTEVEWTRENLSVGSEGTLKQLKGREDITSPTAIVLWDGELETDSLDSLWLDSAHFTLCVECSKPIYEQDYLCSSCRAIPLAS